MTTASVPDVVFSDTGLVLPTEAAILAGVQTDNNAAFGGGLNPALESPQGQMASSLTAIVGDKNDLFAQYVNQTDPNFASGRMQDAIGRIYFLDRKPGTATAVVATCVGLAGTVIPINAQAKATDGNLYVCTQAGTIPIGGSISLNFACIINGPVACPANSLNAIYQSIPGWDSINNVGAGTVGSLVENRANFEFRRKQSVALNAQNTVQSVYANVFNVAGVIDVYAVDNPLSAPATIGGVTVAQNSIYVSVTGGAAADIAKAIWNHKPPGCNYNGNTSFTVTDTSGYNIPYPSYVVTYETPAALPILFAIQIAASPALPSNIIALVQAAIIGAFNGTDGGQRARIGSTIFSSRFYGPLTAINTAVSVLSLLLGPTTPTLASYTVNIDKTPTITASNISVTLV